MSKNRIFLYKNQNHVLQVTVPHLELATEEYVYQQQLIFIKTPYGTYGDERLKQCCWLM